MSEEWKKLVKKNFLDELAKYRSRKIKMAFILIERFSTGI
jgi:hypothetical protein